jgi:AsnC-like helix-turn-helix protein
MVAAYVFIETVNPGPRRICQEIRKIDGVLRADALFGGPPVVAIIQAGDLAAIDALIDRIVEVEGVLDTESHVTRPIPDD